MSRTCLLVGFRWSCSSTNWIFFACVLTCAPFRRHLLTHSQLLEGLKCESKWKTTEEGRVGARSLTHNTLRGRGACWTSGMGLGRIDKLTHSHGPAHNPHKVVSA
jgi:hypothetical protein